MSISHAGQPGTFVPQHPIETAVGSARPVGRASGFDFWSGSGHFVLPITKD